MTPEGGCVTARVVSLKLAGMPGLRELEARLPARPDRLLDGQIVIRIQEERSE